jgi:hypothetical protein
MQSPLTPSPKTANRCFMWELRSYLPIAPEAKPSGSDAWVHAATQVGGDVALSMTIKNEADVTHALLRVRCPVANFSAKHTVDREGSPPMRAIPSIPIAAGSTTVLNLTLIASCCCRLGRRGVQLLHRFFRRPER